MTLDKQERSEPMDELEQHIFLLQDPFGDEAHRLGQEQAVQYLLAHSEQAHPHLLELLVSDQFGYRVQVFDADGVFKYCIGGNSANPGSFFQRGRTLSAPQGLWSDDLGRIYVADSFEGKVKVFDRNARLLAEIGTFGEGGGQLRIPSDVALDQYGRLFVASSNNARVEVFGVDAMAAP